jgi:PAS domain S-box-containing protein
MPGIDVYETCRRIKSDKALSELPVIFMSALHETFDKLNAFDSGAVDYITKPLNPEELLARIRTHLSIAFLQKELKDANTNLEEKVYSRTKELQASELKYRSLFENLQEGIWVTDNNHITTMVNPAMARMLGYLPEEMTGREIFDFMDEKGKEIILRYIEKRKKGLAEQYDFEFIKKDGGIVYTTIEAAPVTDEKGNYIGSLAGVIDISSKKYAEKKLIEKNEEYEALNEELKQTNIKLAKAKERAEEGELLKTAFLQNMSHEIRTPLNAIMGFASLLDKPDLSSEKRKGYTKIILNSGKQLLSIVNDILTISSIETKQERLNPVKVNVNNIIVELLAIFKAQATNQNVSIYAKQHLPDSQTEILTDVTKLTQIMTNLLTNALKFTHEGFIEFGYTFLSDAPDGVSLKKPMLKFYVKDTGIGIKPEFQDKIFDRFNQADKTVHKKYGGTGLGLSISKGFVQLLGGEIWLESEPDKGTTFFFTIPYQPVNEGQKQNDNLETGHSQKPVILVAEDEEFNFLFIEELLHDLNVAILHAKNGNEAVEMCRNNPNIDLILMDIKMPFLDGYNAALKIREFRSDITIIAQSAYALEHEREKYAGPAFDDYITKPIDEKEFYAKIRKFI